VGDEVGEGSYVQVFQGRRDPGPHPGKVRDRHGAQLRQGYPFGEIEERVARGNASFPGRVLLIGRPRHRLRSDVRPDDPADLRDELTFHPELRPELRERVPGPDVPVGQGTSSLRGGLRLLQKGRHLPLASSGPLVRHDLTILDAQDRPEVECRSQQTLSPPYAPALLQVLQACLRRRVSCSALPPPRPPS
jgi:hypothetical protein